MKLLALDTSTNTLSLALSQDQKILKSENWEFAKKVSQMIMPTLRDFLESAKVDSKDIDGYVVGLGPGSFTSLRVGLSVAKAMAFAHEKPICGISSLDAIAAQVKEGNICVINDAKRELLYTSFYQYQNGNLVQMGACELLSIDSVLAKIDQAITCVGSGVELYAKQLKSNPNVSLFESHSDVPDARHLLSSAFLRIENNQWDDINGLAPLYVYPEDCMVTVSKKI